MAVVTFNNRGNIFGGAANEPALWKKSLYTNPNIRFLFNNIITEYDMTKANISVLRKHKLITESEFDILLHAPKKAREVTVGRKLMTDKKMSDALVKGFAEERRRFMEVNNLGVNDILDIRNDAIFVFGPKAAQDLVAEFDDGIKFVRKNTYASYVRFVNNGTPDVSVYWAEDIVDVKGIKDANVDLHREYFLDFLSDIMLRMAIADKEEPLSIIQNFYEDYCELGLDTGFYREFNSDSCFRINVNRADGGCSDWGSTAIDDSQLPLININFNAGLLRQMFSSMSLYYGVKR